MKTVYLSFKVATQIFDLTTQEWSLGPMNPTSEELRSAAVVPYLDTFLLVGGDRNVMGIWQFDVVNMDWIVRPESLIEQRRLHFAYDITYMFLPC